MAEFGNGRKNRVPVSRDDIKQAIKDANARLKKANEKLDQDISNKKKSLSSVSKEISSGEKELKSIASAIQSEKHDAVKVKAEASKERAKLSKLKTQVAEAMSSEDKAQSNLNNLTKESEVLAKKVVKMNDDVAIASTIKEEIKILKSDKKIELKELDEVGSEVKGIKAELPKLQADSIKKKKSHKELLAKLDAEAEIKQKALETVDSEFEIKMAGLNTKFNLLEESLKE
mgnify:CR=1 FL=1